MDPPSTPSPVALRGRLLDRALCEAVPDRKPWSGRTDDAPMTQRDDGDRAMAFAEAFAKGERLAPRSNGPATMRGDDLAAVLEALREPPSHARSR
jgi:hypothetical protein